MLTADRRLKKSRDISRVFSRGRSGSSGPILVKAAKNGGESRAVVVVSKKVSKKAVVRNRIRRRIASWLATEWATVTSGYDIVITVREDISEAPAPDISRHTKAALEKAGVGERKKTKS